MRRRISVLAGLSLALVAPLACRDHSTDPRLNPPAAATPSGGDTQTGTVASRLGTPLAITVKDAKGIPLGGVAVVWAADGTGAGTVDPAQTITDANGQASAFWMLGTVAGVQRAHASVASLTAVAFTATATPDQPSVVKVAPDSVVLDAVGDTARLTATVTDKYTNVITGAAITWRSSDTTVATVNSDGRLTSRTEGTVQVSATVGAATGSSRVRVAQLLSSVSFARDTATLTAVNDTIRLKAIGKDKNGVQLPTVPITYASLDTLIAQSDSLGKVTARANGVARIVATSRGRADTAQVTVSQVAVSLRIKPAPDTINAIGDTVALSANVVDRNGFTVGGTEPVVWATTSSLVIVDATGHVISRAVGVAYVRATRNGMVDSAQVTIRQVLASVAVTAPSPTMTAGASANFLGAARDSNGVAIPGTALTWSSSDATIAAVDNTGHVSVAKVGTANITATVSGLSGVATVQVLPGAAATVTKVSGDGQGAIVSEPVLDSLVVKVVDAFGNLAVGANVQWSVTAGGGTPSPVTSVVGADGLARTRYTLGGAAGLNTVGATAGALTPVTFNAEATVPVGPGGGSVRTPGDVVVITLPAGAVAGNVPLTIAPIANPVADPGFVPGTSFEFGPTGTVFSTPVQVVMHFDPAQIPAGTAASELVLHRLVNGVWQEVVPSSVDVVNNTITASLDHFSIYGILRERVAHIITAAPDTMTFSSIGATQPIVVTLFDIHGFVLNPRLFTYTSANTAVATVNSTNGVVTSTGSGTTKVAVTIGPLGDTVVVKVLQVATSIGVTPATATLNAIGATQQLADTVRDAHGVVMPTAPVTWTTSNAAVATVSTTGLVTAVANGGPVTITATSGTATGTSAITVTQVATTIAVSAGNAQTATANTAVAVPPAVLVTDANGHPVAGIGVTFAATAGNGTIVGGNATTAANGIAAVTSWTLGTTAGAESITATSTGLTGSPITFTATATAGAAATMVKNAGDAQTATAGSALSTAPAVLVTDGFGNPVAGVSVTFAVASGGGSVTGGVQPTNASGIATVGSWTLGTTAGANTLTATAGSLSVTFNATGAAGAATTITKTAGDAQSAVAGSAVATAPSVRITDVHGNPVASLGVTFAVATGGGSVTGGTQTTDANGVATVTSWTLGTTAGANSMTATSGSLVATFTATGTPGAATQMTIQAGDAQTATAGSAVAIAPSVLVQDAHNNPVPGVSVTFAVATGGGSVSPVGGVATTNASGIATLTSWTLGTTSGANTLTATAGTLSRTFNATGTAGVAANIAINAGNNQSATVNTAVAIAPSVLVRDANNNPKSGVSVTFAVATGGGSVSPVGGVATTNASGIATLTSWTLGTTAGANTLSATVTSTSITTTFTATGTPGAPASIAVNAGNNQSATVNTAVAIAPSVVVKDQFSNVVPSADVTFVVSTGGGSVAPIGGAATTNASGIASLTSWTLGTTAGANTLTATVNSTAFSVPFTATGTPGAATQMTIQAGDAQTATAGSAVSVAPSVLLQDAHNNPVSSVSVTFAVATGGGSVSPVGGVETTNASGIATLTSWTLGTTSGPNTLTATAGTLSRTFSATGTAGVATNIAINAGNNQSATVNTAVATAPSVLVTDANNNPKSGVSVTFAVATGGGSVTPVGGVATTNASGIATVGSWTLGSTAGANTLTATAGSLSQTFNATGTAGTATNISKTAGDAQSATVNTNVATAPTVLITDANGNPKSGVSVTFSIATGGGSVTGGSATTDVNGHASVGSWKLGTATGANSLLATAGTLNTTFTATGTPGAPATMTKSAGDAQTATAGSAVTTAPAVTITDAFSNPVPGVSITFAIASGGGSVTGGTQTTNAAGVATVGSWTLGTTAGANTLTATAGALSQTFTATASAGAAANIAINAGNNQSATVNTAVSVAPSVLVTDANNNPKSGVSVTFAVATGGGSVSPVGGVATTNASGIATLTSWTLGTTAGANTLSATVTSTSITTTFTATGTPGAPASIAVNAGNGQSATVNTAVTTAPSVVVKDQFNNVTPGIGVTFVVASGGGSVSPVGGAATTNASGIASLTSWTLGTTAGSNSLTATVNATAFSTTFTATGTAAAPAVMTIQAGDGQSAVAGSAVATAPSVLVTDSHGNPNAGVSVTFAVATGGGSVTGGSATTNASGVATVGSWTLGTTAGANTLTATAGSLSQTFNATGTAGTATNISKTAGDAQSATVNTNVATAPTVLITDANGNPKSGVSVTFSVSTGGGSITGATPTTDVNGHATVGSWKLGTASGANSLLATAGALNVTFTATGTPGALAHFKVEAAGGGAIGTQAAGTPFNVQFTAQDAFNNTATSFVGTVDVTSNRTGTSGLTQSASFTAGVLATHSVTLTTPTGSGATITATNHGSTETGTSAAFTLNPGGVDHFLVEAAGGGPIGTQTAGVAFNVQFTAQDASNNTVTSFTGAGNTVNVTSNKTGTSGLVTSATFTNGVLASHSITLTTPTGADATITATRTSGGTETGTSAAFTLNPGALHHFTVTAVGGATISGQVAGQAFTTDITARDAFGNKVTSFIGTVDVTSNRTGTAGLTQSAAFTAGLLSGHSITLTTPTGAGATVTATNHAGTGETGTSNAFQLDAGAVDHFDVEAAGGGSIGTQAAGTPFNVLITARDIGGNTATSFNGTVDVTSNRTGTSGLTQSSAFTNGVLASHSVTLTTPTGAGATITATNHGGAQTGTSNAFTLNAGTLDHFLVEAAGGGAIATQTAGVPFNVQFTAQDVANNTVTSFTGAGNTVNVTSNRTGTAGLTTSATFTNGVLASHSITLTTTTGAGATITATRTSGGSQAGTSAAFTLNTGALNHFAVEAQGGGPIGAHAAGVSFNVQFTAQDVGNNTVTTFTGAGNTVDVTSNRTASQGINVTSATFTNGVLASHAVTLTQSGAGATITATKTGSTETGTSNTFTIGTPPTVTSTVPTNNAVSVSPAATITVNFSTSVNATTSSFAIECPIGTSKTYTLSSSPAATFTLTPTSALPAGQSCRLTVIAAQVTDALTTAPMQTDVTSSFETSPTTGIDTYPQTVIGNMSVQSANVGTPYSFTTNDQSAESFTITASDATSAHGGTVSGVVTSGPNIGQFVYNPPAGYHGPNDTFTYTITTSGGSTAIGTVTMPISGMVWYIDANAGTNGDGRISNPFNSLASFNAINDGTGNHPAQGDNIFLYETNAVAGYVGPLTLLAHQRLIGQDAGSQLQVLTTLSPPSSSVAFPVTDGGTSNGTNVTITSLSNAITTATGDSLIGFRVGGNNGTGSVAGIAIGGTGNLYIRNVAITQGATGGALSLSSGAANIVLDSTRSSGGTNAVSLTTMTGSVNLQNVGTIPSALSGASGATISVNGGSVGLTVPATVTQANNAAVVSVTGGHTGTINFNGTVSATNGTGLQFNNADGTYSFNLAVTVNTSASQALNINNGSSGAFNLTVGSTAFTNQTGTAVVISNSAPTVDYRGTITKSSVGNGLISITGLTGGTVSFSGLVSQTTSPTPAIAAISDSSNTGGTVNFSNATKTLTTSTAGAVNLRNNTGSTINFTNGGLAITTTSATGFLSSGGGTINVSGSGNTISTSAGGTGLTVQNPTANALTFQSISTSSAVNGIVMVNTGTGGLTVTGNGGRCDVGSTTCTGGTISGATGADGAVAGNGIYLSSAPNVSLTRMRVAGTVQNFGLYGNTVSGLSLNTMLFDGTFGTATTEAAVGFDELTGSPSIINSSIFPASASFGDGIRILNTTGTALTRLTMTADTVGFTGTNGTNDVNILARGSNTTNVTVQNSTFRGGKNKTFVFTDSVSATTNLIFTNNLIQQGTGPYGAGALAALNIRTSGATTHTDSIAFNTFTNLNNPNNAAFEFNPGLPGLGLSGSVDSYIGHNTWGTSGSANSGPAHNAVNIDMRGSGTTRFKVADNAMYQYGDHAFRADTYDDGASSPAGNHNGKMDLTFVRNTIQEPRSTATFVAGVQLDAGRTSGGAMTMCVNFGVGGLNNMNNSGSTDADTPFDILSNTTGNGSFVKYLNYSGSDTGASGLAEGKLDTLIRAGISSSTFDGFLDLSQAALVTSSANNASGAVCNLPAAP